MLSQLDAEEVQRVVHADAHTQGNHRQRGNLHAHTQPDHQDLAENRGQHQRYHRHHHRAPTAEGDEAEHDHRAIHVEQHGAVGFAHDDVGRSFNSGAAGRQHELTIIGAVFTGKGIGDLYHVVEGLGLVVGKIGHHRHHRTIVIEQLGVIHRGLLRAVIEHILITCDGQHLRVALVRARRDLPHRVNQRHGGLHAGLLLQQPAHTIGFHQGFVLQAPFLSGLNHHRELVARQ
ncbi:hypothetical protein D9M69_460840 [compost metagenome]